MNGQLTARPDRMRVPEVCRYCAVRLTGHDGAWVHAFATACTRPRSCDPAERDLRWQDWLDQHPAVRAAGQRGGAACVPVYGAPDRALCGRSLGADPVPAALGMPVCRSCLDRHAAVDYGWRYEQHWQRPYGGTGLAELVTLMGLRPSTA